MQQTGPKAIRIELRKARWALVTCLACWLGFPSADAGQANFALTNPVPPHTEMGLLEAVRQTLAHEPNIQIQQRQVQVGKGVLETASGQFDPALATSLVGGQNRFERSESELVIGGLPNVPTAVQDIVTYRAGITNQFRTGISVYTGIELNRLEDNLYQERAANRADVSFVIRLPLLRGAGRTAVEADERAARMNYDASILELRQTVAARVFNTVSAYWNCLAAVERLGVLRESDRRATALVKGVAELVRLGELAATELLQAQADEAQKTAALSAGRQVLSQTQQELSVAIGLALDKMNVPPVPRFAFPDPETIPSAGPPDVSRLFLRSLERRADYQASLKVQEAARILEAAARRNTKPQLDFSVEAGYATLNESSSFRDYFTTLNPLAATGPRVFGTLSMQWPFGNHAARGVLLQRTAQEQQAQLRSEALARSIYAGLNIGLNALEHSRAQWERSRLAVQEYDRAVRQELEKLRLRTSTIVDVITLADRMEGAQLSQLSALAEYWVAVARCRYETGLLVPRHENVDGIISLLDLTTLPPWYAEPQDSSKR